MYSFGFIIGQVSFLMAQHYDFWTVVAPFIFVCGLLAAYIKEKV